MNPVGMESTRRSHERSLSAAIGLGGVPHVILDTLSTVNETEVRQEQDVRDLYTAALHDTQIPDDTRNKLKIKRRGSLEVELLIAQQPGLAAAVHSTLQKSKSKGSFLRLEDGEQSVVLDVTQLHKRGVDPALRRALLDEALETQEQDNEELLRKYRARLDRVGVQLSKVVVKFSDINVSADVLVGSRGMPTVANAFINKPMELLTAAKLLPSDRHHHTILKGVSGVLLPGRLTLLLGPPGSGKTALLKALAGLLTDKKKAGSDAALKVLGSITYNSETPDTFQVARTCAYISQIDEHKGELTVRETFDFAARCLGTGHKQVYADELRRREKAAGIEPDPEVDAWLKAEAVSGKQHNIVTDLILRILGLEVCADTIVGDQLLRGVSGGQRKRVTTGEMMVGPAKTLFMDEISTGLDSSTSYLIVRCIRNYVHLMEATVMMSLLQPPPEVFNLFDDVLLLSEGHVVYYGPREDVVGFFSNLGFTIPHRKGVADFLQEVTSRKDQQQYWSKPDEQYHFVSVTEFHKAYEASAQGKAMEKALGAPAPELPQDLDPLVRTKYALDNWGVLKACMRREWIMMKRNSFIYIFQAVQMLLMGIITGTLFLRTHLQDDNINNGTLYLGLIFFSIVNSMFSSYAEMTLMIMSLHVYFKQRAAQFFPAWAFALPTTLLRIPGSVLSAVVWSVLVYWLTGLAPGADRFFIYLGYLILLQQMGVALFRLMGALGRDLNITNVYGSFVLVALILLSGFALKRPDTHPWWIWVVWSNPVTYAINALAYNEMSAPRWQRPLTIEGTTRPVGEWVLLTNGLFTESYWHWFPALVLVGYMLLFTALTFLVLQYAPPPRSNTPLFSAGYLAEREINRTGKAPTTLSNMAAEAKDKSGKAGDTTSTRTSNGVTKKGSVNRSNNRGLKDAPISLAAAAPGVLGFDEEMQQVQSVASAGAGSKGLALPFQPIAVAFKDISYFVALPGGGKGPAKTSEAKAELQLLHNISGTFRPGVLTALMGVSGAGKTTLMDVLADRKTAGRTEGQVWVGGWPKNKHSFARICGYVEQNDIHTSRTTVYEALLISASLRLYHTRDSAVIADFVEDVLHLVELHPQRGALVGESGSWGLSIEQRKRLTIAVELVANPSVVFMDEPTSGLDARAAAIVMRAVRNTVNTGRTVVCTIHQPSIHIFDAFDELLLLQRGGRTLYHGPLGKDSCHLIAYLTATPGVKAPAEELNPATWMLDVSSVGSEAKLGVNFADVYEQSDLKKHTDDLVLELSRPASESKPITFDRPFAASSLQQFQVLMLRWWRSYWRNPGYNATRFAFCTVLGILLGTIYLWFGQRRNTLNDVTNIMGALFICITFLGTSNSSGVQPIVSAERPVFYRELAAGMYSPMPFALAQVLVELPYVVLQALLYGTITYLLIEFELTAAKFWWYILFTLLTLLFFTYYGMMSVAVSSNVQIAAIAGGSIYSIWFIFAGFFVPYAAMPKWWSWFYWLDPLSYMIYGIITSQLGDVEDTISVAPGQTMTVQGLLENMLGYNTWFVGYCALIMFGFILAFWVSIITALKYLHFEKR